MMGEIVAVNGGYLMLQANIDFINRVFSDADGYKLDSQQKPPMIYQRQQKEKYMKINLDSSGYPQVQLFMGGKFKTLKMHLIIAVLGGLDLRSDVEINHLDGDKTNYNLSNLEVVDRSGNIRHAVSTGLNNKKLTPAKVVDIRTKYASGFNSRILAEEYGICVQMVNRVVSGSSWFSTERVDLGVTRRKLKGNDRLIPANVIEIRSLYDSGGYTLKAIGAMFGVSYATIGDIIRGKSWRDVI